MALDDADRAGWSGTARVVRGPDVLEERSAGRVVTPDGPACSPSTRFQAGSISKLLVSAVVLALVERGELDLHQPVRRWLTGRPAAWDQVTLHQLLSQTSGLGHWADLPGLAETFATAPPEPDELASTIAQAPLLHAPGERWAYSGPGFVVAALVVGAATGVAYGDVAAELVLGPAGLRSTTSGRFPVGAADVAVGHHRGAPLVVDEAFTRIPGTGDLWTTVGDLVRLHQALRSDRVLRPDVAALLWVPHAQLVRTSPPDPGPVVTDAYGYGTFLGRVRGHRARLNPGDNPGYQSLLAHLPDTDVDLAVLTNDDDPGVDGALTRLTSL